MMEDCVNGKIKLVLTKSISRFGRDTVDGLSAIRELKAHGVEVYFDLEDFIPFSRTLNYNILSARRSLRESGKTSMTALFLP